jgi:hypothetical protein
MAQPHESGEEFAAQEERGAEMHAQAASEAVPHVIEIDRFCRIEFQHGPVAVRGVNGVTLEAVLAALIKHVNGLAAAVPSRETSLVITKLEEALLWQQRRTFLREERGVAGTYRK